MQWLCAKALWHVYKLNVNRVENRIILKFKT